jgi:hypothetical protein
MSGMLTKPNITLIATAPAAYHQRNGWAAAAANPTRPHQKSASPK